MNLPVGTLRFYSPAEIDPRKTIDHRSDIYSFWIVLFEMLTGDPIFKFSTRGESLPLFRTQILDIKSDSFISQLKGLIGNFSMILNLAI